MKRTLAFLTAFLMGMSAVSMTNVDDVKYVTASAESPNSELPELKDGEVRVIVTDYDTGELIPEEVISSMEYFMMGTNIGYKNPNVAGGWMYTGPMFEIKNNPYSCNELAKFIDADLFEVRLGSTVDGYYSPDDSPIITKNNNGSLEIEFRLKKNPEVIKTGKVEGCSESNLTYTLDSEGTLTISGEGEIPCHVGFSDNSIKKVVIEDGVTGIGMESFFCKNIETIILPENGCCIDSYAFSDSGKLKEIYISDTQKGGISATAFGKRDSSFTVIGYDDTYAQLYAEMAGFTFKSLGKPERKILVSDSLGGDVKYDFYNTLEAVISGKGKMNDYDYKTTPFVCCAVKSVTVEEGVTNIPDGFFTECIKLTQITLPDSLTSIGSAVFYGCTALTELTIPQNVTSIGEEVFLRAENFKTIKGYKGSYAETYAKENGFEFISVDDEIVKGDVNSDNEFNIADVVTFEKWLLGSSDTVITNRRAADLCKDGELNVFDLCIMKSELIAQSQTKPVQITEKDIIELVKNQENLTSADFEKFLKIEYSDYNAYLTKDGRFILYIGYDKDENVTSLYITTSDSYSGIDIDKENVEEYFAERMPDIEIVEPDVSFLSNGAFDIVGDNRNLYSGPGTDYEIIEEIKGYNHLYEMGYNYGNDDWVYTQNGDKYGWVKVFTNDGKDKNIEFITFAYDKPVIYLYPEKETDVHVELELKSGNLATTYPKYNNGWDVTAYPDGSLLNKADGTHHKYLFWDAVDVKVNFDLSKGFCVAGNDTESFLKEKLTYMGLNEQEMNEFIVYWLPLMEHNTYNLISFQSDVYTDSAQLNITPTPDSLCRIFMTYIPLDEKTEIEPQQLNTFERKGFTVVEWGGSEIKH